MGRPELNRLMLCVGPMRRPGWKTLDSNPKDRPDFLASIPPLPSEVKAIAWDEIELIHGITSFYPWDAETLLIELRTVLSPAGKLVLEQPDFRKSNETVQNMFGDASFHNPLLMNRWAYTPDSLTALLEKVGFSEINLLRAEHHLPARDFRVEAFA